MSVVQRNCIGPKFLYLGVRWAMPALLLFRGARGAAAQEAQGPIALRWEAPEGCPSGEAVLGEVAQLLGGAPGKDSGRRLKARGKVTRSGQGSFRLVLRTEGEDGVGERRISASSCETLGDAAALVIAMAFDPVAVALQSQREVLPEEARTPAEGAGGAAPSGSPGDAGDAGASAAPTTGAAAGEAAAGPALPAWPVLLPLSSRPLEPLVPSWGPAVDEERPRAVSVSLGAGLGVDAGSFAVPTLQMSVWVGWLLQPYRLEGRFTFLPDSNAEVPGQSGTGGRFRLLSGSLVGCRALLPWRSTGATRSPRVELAGCAAAELGWMDAEGYGVADPGEGGSPWAALHAGAALTVGVAGPLHVRIEGGAGVPFIRRAFVLERVGEVHTPSPVVGRAAGGVALRF